MTTNLPLTSMNISLPEPLREFVDEQVARGGFGSASEYVQQLIRHAKEGAEAESKLLGALERGGRIELNGEYWQKKASLIADLIRKKASTRESPETSASSTPPIG
jgi:antitoxin ParD1/3/4